MASGDDWLGWLARGAEGEAPGRAMLVVAHPDDESVGLGGHLTALRPVAVVCVTDGAPRRFAHAAALAARRRDELGAALAEAGLAPDVLRLLGAPDQEAIFRWPALAKALIRLIGELRPDAVFTHAYEGGHPDHDATALAVHRALDELRARPALLEFACYNARGRLRFLPSGTRVIEAELDAERRSLKARLVACHASQRDVLAGFPIDVERFRLAPEYDFHAPPHPGELHYERYDWGVDGRRWRELAAGAAA